MVPRKTTLKGCLGSIMVGYEYRWISDFDHALAHHRRFDAVGTMSRAAEAMKGTTDGRELTTKSEAGDAQLLISVSDTSMGFPPEQADQIFRAFFTTKDKGTSMGLPISRSIIESHGGRMWAAGSSDEAQLSTLPCPPRLRRTPDGSPATTCWPSFFLCKGYPTMSAHGSPRG